MLYFFQCLSNILFIKYCQRSKEWFITVCFLSCFSCGTTEKFTVSEPEISYCVFFCVMCWLFCFGVGCFVFVIFLELHEKKQEILLHLVLFDILLYLFNHYGILNFLLCQLNNTFTAVVKLLGKVFFDLQLYYIVVMPDSIMVGKVCFCLWLVFMRVFYSFISAFWADMQCL